MGMFDRVYIRCPKCGRMVEFQSKAGACLLDEHFEHSVPVEIAEDIENTVMECRHCGTRVVALPVVPVRTIAMHGVDEYELLSGGKGDEDFE